MEVVPGGIRTGLGLAGVSRGGSWRPLNRGLLLSSFRRINDPYTASKALGFVRWLRLVSGARWTENDLSGLWCRLRKGPS